MEQKIFSGVRERWLPLYRELKGMAEKALGAFETRVTGAAVIWRHTGGFAEIGARKDCMILAFAAADIHDEWEPAKVLRTSKNRAVHYFEVRDNRDFPVLVERIAGAYALTKAAKPPKREEGKGEFRGIDEYIALFPPPQRAVMEKVRQTIRRAAPEAVEKISWQMPTFYQNGNLLHFAAAKAHLGIYPGPEAMEAFKDKLAPYKTSKGAAQFPWDRPVPYELIAGITRFRVKQAGGK
jgi:uncharacterized protein YdhG (YjbR/CyaY superfamily)